MPIAHAHDRFPVQPALSIRLLHVVDRLYSRAFHHVHVSGVQRLPRRGAAVVVANHISSLDPVLIQSTIARPIVWMMAREYFDLPRLGWLFRTLELIPVARDGNDAAALRSALRVLKDGRLLGIFPEGRLATRRVVGPFETGAALIAMRGKAPIHPVRLEGTPRGASMAGAFAWPQEVRLHFAPPLELAATRSPGAVEAATRVIRQAVLDADTIAGEPPLTRI